MTPVDAVEMMKRSEDERRLTRDPHTCQHSEAHWNAEDDCWSCGAEMAPEERQAPDAERG